MNRMRFKDKSVFITGGGGYIGSETARMFAREGARVAVCDINEEVVNAAVASIEAEGGEAIGLVMDVTDSKSVDEAVAKTVERFGGLDVMVHVAGGAARKRAQRLVNQTDEVLDSVIGVNLFGAIWSSRAAARVMIKQGRGGRIINISSCVAFNGLKTSVDYAAAKNGIIGMTHALAKELGEYGITVNSVAPGVVAHEGSSEAYAYGTNFLNQRCMPADIGSAVLFVASDEARFMTGQTYLVDGGRGLGMKGTD